MTSFPSRYEPLGDLPPVGGVVRARRSADGAVVAVRIGREGEAGATSAELAVLARVDHPGLSRYVDHGTLADGSPWIARSWIDGADAWAWARGRSPEEVGALVARLCAPLEHLHRRGFVHADLKPENVIVSAGGGPVLTDFGLARSSGTSSGDVSGSLYGIAPEVLRGRPAAPKSDLFGLGALLHALLCGERAGAREFYARFPGEDYFTASRTRVQDLPVWSRDLLEALLARRPAERPESAERVGRTLAGRLSVPDPFRDTRPRIVVDARAGREAWFDDLVGRVTELGSAEVLRLSFPEREDAAPLWGELALALAVEGVASAEVDPREVALHRNEAALDLWARRTVAGAPGRVLLVPRAPDPWARRAFDVLAATARQTGAQARAARLVVAGDRGHAGDAGTIDVPPLTRERLREFLAARIEGVQPARIAELAEVLDRAAAGSRERLQEALDDLVARDVVLRGRELLTLRPGRLPKVSPGGTARAVPATEEGRALLAAAAVLGGRAPLDLLVEVSGLDADRLPGAVEAVEAAGAARRERDARGVLGLSTSSALSASDLVTAEDLARMHRRVARRLAASGGPAHRVLLHEYGAGEASAADVAGESAALRERGLAELALEVAEEGLEAAPVAGEGRGLLRAEAALAWCALGRADEALRAVESLGGDARERAGRERVLGQVAWLRHETAAAIEHLERAADLDATRSGEALLARARMLFESGRHAEVLDASRSADSAEWDRRTRDNLRAIVAMSEFRLGRTEEARRALEEQLDEARGADDAARCAALCINLATVARRTGALRRAVGYLEEAVRRFEESGRLSGLAQARSQLGSVLRDVGELSTAGPLLEDAIDTRERLGDAIGAASTRGILGLVLADRGHAHAAAVELDASARALRESGRTRDALLLEARRSELRARLGVAPATADDVGEDLRAGEGDPRALLAAARAAWNAGREQDAADRLERSLALATTLGLSAVRDEAGALLALRAGERPDFRGEPASLVDEDRWIWSAFSRPEWDEAAVVDFATGLEQRGRDDRAARLWIAATVRARTREDAARFRERALRCMDACTRGASPDEAESLRGALLGIPDPWPEDIAAFAKHLSSEDEGDEDVIELLSINHRLVEQERLDSLLGAIVEQALRVTGARRGFLILEEDGQLAFDTARDSRRGGIEEPEVHVSSSVLAEALERMSPVRVSNAVDDPLLGAAPSVTSLDLRSILCVPFEVAEGLRGVVYVDHDLREGAFDARAEKVLGLLADQAALAIRQVRRLEEIRRLNRQLRRAVVDREADLDAARSALRAAGVSAEQHGLIGRSPAMAKVRELIERAAPSRIPALIVGPSGSGKELAARAFHSRSPWSSGPFVCESCAALPPTLIEAELFGARKGAFTGADRDRDGIFERAHGGTVFLDEIGELPMELQAKLLRVLETSEVRRLGDTDPLRVDFRLVAATNRDLADEVRAGNFRSDLLFRLDGVRVRMPALSERTEDVPALVEHFLRLEAGPEEQPRAVAPAVLARLSARPWPGNVRELANEVARLCVLSEGDLVDPELVRTPELGGPASRPGAVRPLAELEREAIEAALVATGGDKRRAAELLGISRAKVYQRLKEWAASS